LGQPIETDPSGRRGEVEIGHPSNSGVWETVLPFGGSASRSRRVPGSHRPLCATYLVGCFGKGVACVAAKLLNVSERSLKVAKAIVRKGEPEIAKAVEAGAMTLQQPVFLGSSQRHGRRWRAAGPGFLPFDAEHVYRLGMPFSPFKPKWSNSKALRIGYLTGLGRTARAIAEELADGTTPESIRGQWRRHGIVDRRRDGVDIRVRLSSYELKALGQAAEARGLDPEEWVRRVASAAIRDDLFDAVVDESPVSPKCAWGGDRHSAAFRASRGLVDAE